MVGVPAAQVHQQVADGAGFRRTVGPLQGLAERRRQGHCGVACGPLLQQAELLELRLGQPGRVERLPLAQGVMPGQLLALLQVLALSGLAQAAQVVEGPGADALLTHTKPELVAVQPKPGCSKLQRVVTPHHKLTPAGQVQAFRLVVLKQQPGSGPIARWWLGGAEGLGAEVPWKNPQPAWWIDTGRQGAEQLNVAQGTQLGAGRWPDRKLQPAGLHGQNDGKSGLAFAAPVVRQADQIAGMEADLGQDEVSPRDSRKAAGPRCGHASRHW